MMRQGYGAGDGPWRRGEALSACRREIVPTCCTLSRATADSQQLRSARLDIPAREEPAAEENDADSDHGGRQHPLRQRQALPADADDALEEEEADHEQG